MSSLWRRCSAWLRAPANEVAFLLRSQIAWSRGPARLPQADKAGMFVDLPPGRRAAAAARAARLRRDYDLGALAQHSSTVVWAKNLALLENLERLAAGIELPPGPVRAFDVGSGDFHYATALHRFLARHGAAAPRPVVLHGCEIDGHGVYRDGHARADHARAHAALAAADGSVQFTVADAAALLPSLPPQDVVTLFFPFLSAYPLLQWGLPLSRWRPRRLLRQVVASLRPGGWLLVGNQTGVEFARLRALLAGLPVACARDVSFASDLVPDAERTAGQVGSLWRRVDLRPGAVSG